MKIITAILLSVVLISCSVKTIPLKGEYEKGSYTGQSSRSKDAVWESIIDFFAVKGIPIKLIDRSSGLIISDRSEMTYTHENSKGELMDKTAWIVLEKTIDPGSRKIIKFYNVTAEWNIRIKDSDGKTSINVNLVNPTHTAFFGEGKVVGFKQGSFQSTGVFERQVYEIIE